MTAQQKRAEAAYIIKRGRLRVAKAAYDLAQREYEEARQDLIDADEAAEVEQSEDYDPYEAIGESRFGLPGGGSL